MFKSFGVLEYHDSGWIILRCCDDLAKYYRKSLKMKGLRSPPYGAHITIVNGRVLEDDITKHESWLKYNEQEIEFEYMTEIISADGYWWLLVRCNQLLDLREELNLPRELKFPLHLTIAKIKEERV